jgi:hypothetical protein
LTLPSRKLQIEAIEKLLDDPKHEELSLNGFATMIVDGYHDLLTRDIKAGSPPLHEGARFKSPFTTKVHEIRWVQGERAWIVTADSRFGWFGPLDSPFWQYTEHTTAKPLPKNDSWAEGEKVFRNQGLYHGAILRTGPKCVLLECRQTGNITVESNDNMEKHYRREG